MTRRTIGALLAAVLVGATAVVSVAQVSPNAIEEAIPRTVLLNTLVRPEDQDGRLVIFATCSGAFVTPEGLILTASHCVRATEDVPKFSIAKGQLFMPEGLMAVSVNVPEQPRPVLTMIAKYVADDPELDLALVKTEALIGSGSVRPLPADFRVPVMPVGNAEAVRHGEPIAVIGFPTVGGETVTVSQGFVAGFLADPQGRKTVMKIDVQAGQGASGGPVINARGEEVGVISHFLYRTQVVERSMRATLTSRLPQRWAPYFRGELPAGPPPSAVFVQGRVVDAVTGAGIVGAGVYLLKPGASMRVPAAEDALATATADGTGLFQTKPPVSRGAVYPVVIMAGGYQRVSGTLDLAPSGPDVVSIGTIQLQRQ
jgi:hypothetical protein